MMKSITILTTFIITALFIVGCSSSNDIQDNNTEDIALIEARKIASQQEYSLKLDETIAYSDILIDDSEVFKLIKDASIKYGYSEIDLNSMTENGKVLGYELEEISKENKPIKLCLVIDNEKVIGAYLDYEGYFQGIAPVDFKENFK